MPRRRRALVSAFALVLALITLVGPHVLSAPAGTPPTTNPPPGSRIYATLNLPDDDAWVIPVAKTRGEGVLVDRSARLQLSVLMGYIGTDTSDDRCSTPGFRQSKGKEMSYAATFELSIHNAGTSEANLSALDFSLVRGTKPFPLRLVGPVVGSGFVAQPRTTVRNYFAADTLPRGESIYRLRFRASYTVPWHLVGAYRVIPNGKDPCWGK